MDEYLRGTLTMKKTTIKLEIESHKDDEGNIWDIEIE